MIGTKVGSSASATRPLWVRMRGGGVGFFDSDGNPQPSAGNKSEESAATSIGFVKDTGLMRLVRADAAGFRLVSVSMCNHDIYAGGDQPDPNNPNTLPDGSGRTINGLFATKAAIQFAKAHVPDRQDLPARHERGLGRRAVGVAWSLQEQGIPPAGAIADSGVVNVEWEQAQFEQGIVPDSRRDAGGARRDPRAQPVPARRHPTTSPTSSSAAAIWRCRSCTPGAAPTRTSAARPR